MALILADRVRETTTTTGTGSITFAGALTGFQTFSAAVGDGNTTYYVIAGQGTSEWEVGVGTYASSGNTLARTTVLASSNGGSLVNFSAGTKDVWVDYAAGKAVTTDTLAYPPAIGGTTPAAGTFTTLTSPILRSATGSSIAGVSLETPLGAQATIIDVGDGTRPLRINGGSAGAVASAGISSSTGFLQLSAANSDVRSYTGGRGATLQFNVAHTASAVNYVQVTGSATTKATIVSSQGSDANISSVFQPKGTGAIDLAAGSSGVNISNGGTVTAITRTVNGSGYTSFPSIAISAPTTAGGVQATASNTYMQNLAATIQSGGTGYTVGDLLTMVGGTPFASAGIFTVATVSGGVVTSVTNSSFQNYSVLPSNPVSVTGGTGTGCTLNVTYLISGIFNITNAGSGYVEQPTVTFSGGGGSAAAAYATVGSSTVQKTIGNIHTFATPNSNVLALVDKNAAGNYPTNTSVAFAMVPSQSAFGASYFGFGSAAYLATTSTSTSAAYQFATAAPSPISNGGGGSTQMTIAHTASAVNYVQVTGAATTKATVVSSAGSDSNISSVFQSKGTGAIDLAAGSSGVNISNGGTVTAITRTATGTGYTSVPSLAISAPTTAGGVQATASPYMAGQTVAVSAGGTGYTVGDTLTVVGGTFITAAQLRVDSISAGVVTATSFVNTAGVYSVLPTNPVSVTGGTGSGATFNISAWFVASTAPNITNAGSGYVEQPTVTFSGGGGSGAAAFADVGATSIIRAIGGNLNFFTSAGISTTQPSFQIRNNTASIANYLATLPTASGGAVYTGVVGTDPTASAFWFTRGTGFHSFATNSGAQEQLRVSHTASAVNYVQVTGAATGSAPIISAQGSDGSIQLRLSSKGTQSIRFDNNNTANQIFRIDGTATNSVNYLQVAGANAGAMPVISSQGSDTNIDLTLTPKGTGNVRFGVYDGTVLAITGFIQIKDASGTIRKLAVVA